MAKKYFIEYLEDRENWLVSEGEIICYTTSFSKGVHITRHSGFDRKKDAMRHANLLNNAAGYGVAKYWGSADV